LASLTILHVSRYIGLIDVFQITFSLANRPAVLGITPKVHECILLARNIYTFSMSVNPQNNSTAIINSEDNLIQKVEDCIVKGGL
jgi:hypothetical protein